MPPPPAESAAIRRRQAPRGAVAYEWTALLLAAIPALAGPVLFGAVRLWSVAPLMLCAYGAFLLYALRPVVFRAEVPLSIPPASLPALAFVAYVALTVPFAVAPYEAMLRLLMLGSGLAVYWVIAGLSGRSGKWKWLVALVLIVASLDGVYAAMQHLQGSRMMLGIERHPSYLMRMGGTYNCPNHFANLLAMAMAFGLAVLLAPETGWTLKVVAVYALGMMAWPLVLSQSRAGFAAAIVGCGTTLLLSAWRRGVKQAALALVAVPLVAVIVVGVVWAKAPDLRGRLERSSTDLQGRIEVWRGTVRMIASAPVFGHGGGSFRQLDSLYVALPPNVAAVHAHNDYLHVAAEYGVVGGALGLIVAGTLLVRLLRLQGRTRKDLNAILSAGAVGALAAAASQALVDFNLHIYGNSMVLLLLLGCVAALFHASGDLPNPLPSRRRGRWIAWSGAAIALLAMVVTLRAGVAYALTTFAGQPALDASRMEDAAGWFRRALAWDSHAWEPVLGLCRIAAREAAEESDPGRRAARIQEALQLCKTGFDRNPREPGFEHTMSQLLQMQGDSPGALALLRKLVNDHPNRPALQAKLGIQLERMGRIEEAVEAFRVAARMDPADKTTRMYLRVAEMKLAQSKAPPPSSNP
jgi:O-antigen ligase